MFSEFENIKYGSRRNPRVSRETQGT